MSQNPEVSPAIGLDVGTSRIVIARPANAENASAGNTYDSQLNAFVSIPYSKLTAAALLRENVPHTVEAQQILVHGNESEKFAGLLNAEIRRPMTRGVLDPKEPDSLKVTREILSRMLGAPDLGAPDREKPVTPPRVCFTVPAAPLGAADSLTYHEATLRQTLEELGYEPSSINEGLAVVYGELEDSNYTGIGISCGGGLCNVCLAYLSVPVLSFSIPKAGDYIDASAAQVTGERANLVRLAKEDSFHFNGFFADKMQQVIGVYYDDMLRSLVAALQEAFARTSSLPKFNRPIPIVLSGGTAVPAGFRDRFEKLLWEQEFPITVSEIRLAQNPLYATAKGALTCALSEA
jgi:hypothetical protein